MTTPKRIALDEVGRRSRVHGPKERERVNMDVEPVLTVDTLGDFMRLDLPPREMILAPILAERSLTMIHAWRGVGKTWVTLAMALAVAGASTCFRWNAPRPRRVLLIDGEMPAVALQERLAQLIKGAQPPLSTDASGNLQIIAADRQGNGLPDLASLKGQQAVAPAVEIADVIILDNLSTLFGIRENEADDFAAVNAYLISIRRAGKSVIIIHHQGKGGQQRGSSRKEDVLDLVLALKRPDDFDPEEGCRFVVEVEKARGLMGDTLKSFEARLTITDDGARWTITDPVDPVLEEVQSLMAEGKTQREIQKALEDMGMKKSLGLVNKLVRRITEARND